MRITLLLLLFISTNFFGQEALKIKYGKQTKMEIKEDTQQKNPEMAEAMLKAMQEVRDYEMIVLNNQAEYVFKEKINNQQDDMTEGISYKVSFGSSDENFYSDYQDGRHFKSFTANGKFNIIKSELEPKEWELTRDSKEILGVKVRKATFEDEKEMMEAWYAPAIAYKAGPEDFWGLPGLILELKRETKIKGDRKRTVHIFAQEITSLDPSLVKITFPDESKSISKEEHEEENKKYFENLKEMYSQGVDTSD